MKIFEKLKFNTDQEKVRQIRIFNHLVLEYYTKHGSRKKHYDFLPRLKKDRSYSTTSDTDSVFYLKVNRQDDYVFRCLQHWIHIIGWMNKDFYIICDNPKLEKMIYQKIHFNKRNIKFIKSIKKPLHSIVSNIATPMWIKATYAHLTTFYHAKQKGFKSFWNIDADDTMFALHEGDCAKALNDISNYAKNNDIKAFSLDMHTSRTKGKHWSFGITYTDAKYDWFGLLNKNKDTKWREKYLTYDYHFNLDWYFTYLHDNKLCNVKTFYIENSYFIHFGDFLANSIGSGVFHWTNNRIKFPILLDIFGSQTFGDIPISKKCIKFDYNLNPKNAFRFMQKYQTYLEEPSLPRDNMWLSEEV